MPLQIIEATSPQQIEVVRQLFLDYSDSLDIDLGFQGFSEELEALPGAYAAPRGALLLALDGDDVMGCVALRPLDDQVGEIKRLYVTPAARGRGVGRALTQSVLEAARSCGYARVRLDTLPTMDAAQQMYRQLGFREIEPYRYNPVQDTRFLELELAPVRDARLIYSTMLSLDGYVADKDGGFDWAMPDPEVHAFANELERHIGTVLYGRRMYDVMKVWELPEMIEDAPDYIQEYARVWRAEDKVVYSTTLDEVSTQNTRLERVFDPKAVAQMKRTATRDIAIAGPTLAAAALEAGLVDEVHLLVSPAIVGGGLSAFPPGFSAGLELLDERRFANGTVYLRYRLVPVD